MIGYAMDFDRMLRYCAALEAHNDRAWFHDEANHALYTLARQDFVSLVETLSFRIASLATPDLAEKLLFADAKTRFF